MDKKIEALLNKQIVTEDEIAILIDSADKNYLEGDYIYAKKIVSYLLAQNQSRNLFKPQDRLYLNILLAKIYLNNNDPLSAESVLDPVFEESLSIFGPRHCFSLSVLHHLAKAKSLLGKHKEASHLFLKEVFSLSPLDRDGELYEGAYEAYCREKAAYLEDDANPSR